MSSGTIIQAPASLRIADIVCGYGKRRILDKLTLPELQPGRVLSLVGPNGAGKSTLLRAIAGLNKATGSVHYGAVDLLKLSMKGKARYLSFMPQMVPQDVSLPVIDAVISALKASPFDPLDQANASVYTLSLNMLKRVGIEELALQNLDQLSGGQRQLASLARSVVREPSILLLDEPTSALDLRHQVAVMKLIRSFAGDGRIVMVVLHDLNMAMRWSDEVIVLKEGKLVAAGIPEQALTPESVWEVYGIRVRVEACSKGIPQVLVDA